MNMIRLNKKCIFSSFLICLVLTVVVNVISGIVITYTHLYIYPYQPYWNLVSTTFIFLAAALRLIHIACDYATIKAFKVGSLLRVVVFMVLAYVTS
jgi:hypothetical protein